MVLKRAFIGVLVLVAAVFLYIGYSSYDAGRASASATTTTSGAKARLLEGPISTTPTTVEGAEIPSSGAASPSAGVTAPATDTIQPNPPNGMTFGGSGHYQLYRQGNLTWRLNTDTGESCIVFATEEEWRKPQVFRAGCKNRGV